MFCKTKIPNSQRAPTRSAHDIKMMELYNPLKERHDNKAVQWCSTCMHMERYNNSGKSDQQPWCFKCVRAPCKEHFSYDIMSDDDTDDTEETDKYKVELAHYIY